MKLTAGRDMTTREGVGDSKLGLVSSLKKDKENCLIIYLTTISSHDSFPDIKAGENR